MKTNKAYLYFLINNKDMSIKDFRNKIGMSMTTWYKRMKDSNTFSLSEMRVIKDVLTLSLEELNELFFKQ